MRLIDIFVEEMSKYAFCHPDQVRQLAYDTCPSDVDPHEDIREEEVEATRLFFRTQLARIHAARSH